MEMQKVHYSEDLAVSASRKDKEKNYWLKKFSGELQKCSFPFDYMKTSTNKPAMDYQGFAISGDTFDNLIKLSKGSDYTLYIVLLSALVLLIHKYTGQEDIIVGAPIFKQKQEGNFLNTVLALRNPINTGATFKELLLRVRQNLREAIENQNYPLEVLCYNLKLPGPGDEFSLFEIGLMLENIHERKYIKHIELNVFFSFKRKEDHVEINLEYNSYLYKQSTIKRIGIHLINLLTGVLSDIELSLCSIEILSVQEKKQLLVEFNNNRADFPHDRSLHQFIDAQAVTGPHRIAVVFEDTRLTYRQLNESTNQLALYLRNLGIRQDRTVGILLERSQRMTESILAVWKAGGAYIPINPQYPPQRLIGILEDCRAPLLITHPRDAQNAMPTLEESYKGQIITLDTIESPLKAGQTSWENMESQASIHCLAYVIYTSGSTGKPKGAMVEHTGMMNHIHAKINDLQITSQSIIAQNASHTFDISIWQFFAALTTGGKTVIYPDPVVLDPDQIISRLIKDRVTILEVVPSYLTVLLDYFADPPYTVSLILDYLLVTGEEIKPHLVKKWFEKYPQIKLVNAYGPTEASDDITHYVMEKAADAQRIPIGKPLQNLDIYIVDKNMQLCPMGVKGEICVSGIGVGRGYLNDPELTAERFLPVTSRFYRSYRSYMSYIPKRLYKTGDWGRWLSNGTIEFFGRLDSQVKIRGFRIEMGEIESQLVNHPDVKEAVVVIKKGKNENKYLCAYLVADKQLNIPVIQEYLMDNLPDYMMPDYLVELEELPLTANGKVDRKALTVDDIYIPNEYTAPGNEIQKILAQIWHEVLGVEKEVIGIDTNYFELGGHSLNATVMAAKIHKNLKVKLPLVEVFKTPTIRDLSRIIKGMTTERYESIEPIEKKEYYPASSAQKRLYFLQQMDPQNTVYNMPEVIPLTGEIDIAKLEETFKKLLKRHESLRTSFKMIGNEPRQRIHHEVEFEIENYNVPVQTHHSFIRPFDLSRPPLLRVGLKRTGNKNHLLLVDMHHITADGVSQDILAKDFASLYANEPLPPLRLRYKDVCIWQNSEREKQNLEQQEAYWLKVFDGEIPVLDIPTDYTRPKIQDFEGNTLHFEISRQCTHRLKSMVLEENVTAYMVLLGVYNILLSRLSGQEDIVVGTAVAGRRHPDLEKIIGMFVNTLPLRNYPNKAMTFKEFLADVKKRTLEAFENQVYPFEELVDKVMVKRDISRNPLFDVMFALENFGIPGLKAKSPPDETPGILEIYEMQTAKFDMNLVGVEGEDNFFFVFEYCTKLFKSETIRRFAGYFKKILAAVLEDPGKKISAIEIIPAEERKQILYDFNSAAAQYPEDKTLHQLYAEQVERTPDNIAVVGPRQLGEGTRGFTPLPVLVSITYGELNKKSNQLAYLLKEKGVQADSIVGIMVERCVEMIIGLLGILKAGGAYLPIDPEYPEERIDFMLKDSNARILLKKSEIRNPKSETNPNDPNSNDQSKRAEVTVLDFEHLNFEFVSNFEFRASNFVSSNLAYVIYTSGTTGKPKGTLTTHANVIRVARKTNYIDITAKDRILQLSSYVFDGSVFDIYGALLNGAALVLLKKEDVFSMEKLSGLIKKEVITVFFVTTALFNKIVELEIQCLRNIRKVLFGGETISVEHTRKAYEYLGKNRVIHVYGPTETTVYASYYAINQMKKNAPTIPIGKPISKTTVYILDNNLELVPIGVIGEIIIGGQGVARGYLNRPELTAEKFSLRRPGTLFEKTAPGPRKNFLLEVPNKDYMQSCNHAAMQLFHHHPIPPFPHSPIYLTGDLARWLWDGNIEFSGRRDHQVKIRGFRVELGEIENQLLTHEAIREALVTMKEDSRADKYLCAYIAVGSKDQEPGSAAVREYLSARLPGYMIPSFFIFLERFPLTVTGKIDRNALPEPVIQPGEDYAAPRDPIEQKLTGIWSKVLGIDELQVSPGIGIDSNFFEMGGHSLKATFLAAKIHEAFNIQLPLAEIFLNPTIRGLARYIKSARKSKFTPVAPLEKKEYYASSSAQKRMFILQQMKSSSTVYNMPDVIILEEKIETAKLEKTLQALIQRHESLRTSFHMKEDQPVQRVHDEVEFKTEYYETGSHHSSFIIHHSFIRPFDLSRAPLLRVGLIKLEDQKHFLMVDMHHIISDGVSQGILINDFLALYDGKSLPWLRIQYKDFTQWQNKEKQTEIMKQQEIFWLNRYKGEIPKLDLPTDYTRTDAKFFEGGSLVDEISCDINLLETIALENGATMFMVLLATYYIFLNKITGQEDIIIGTPVAGRRHSDLQGIIGFFVNTLVLRNQPKTEKTFIEFLQEVKKETLEAFDNQDYQFDELVERLALKRDRHNPLFDVTFTYQEQDKNAHTGMEDIEYENEHRTAKFDLTLGIVVGKQLYFYFEYSTKLFKKETIKIFARCYKEVVESVINDKNIQLKNIKMTSDLSDTRIGDIQEELAAVQF